MDDIAVLKAETAIAATKRSSETKIQGLDQIIAISEDSINSVLNHRFSQQFTKVKDVRLREFKHAIPDYGNITAVLSAPRVRLSVPEAPESVLFFLNFASGSFDYWSGFGPKAKLHTQSVTGWSVAFKTGFGLAKLASIPKDIADKISLLNAGSYSVSQLLLGFSAARAAELDWDVSICPGLDENQSLKFAAQNVFKTHMDMYMKYLSAGPYSVLGYAIKVEPEAKALASGDKPTEQSGSPAPSFPPTKVRVRTQDYMPTTDDFKTRFPQRAGLDAIIFEEMCESREFPEVPYDPVKAGNWAVDKTGITLAMSKRIFIERFMLDKCAQLNMQCIDLANNAFYWVRGYKGFKMTGNDWHLTQDAKPATAPWTITEDCATYKWQARNWVDHNSFFGGQWRDHLTTDFDNRLTWSAGSDTIKLSVSIKQERDEHNGGHGEMGGELNTSWITTIQWETTIQLTTIKGGRLEVVVSNAEPTVKAIYSSTQLAWDWSGKEKQDYENTAKEAMQQGFRLTNYQDDLQKALNGQSSFVFPGAGDFELKNAIFNTEGDLLIELSYMSKTIAIDDDFHLQVSAPKHPEIHGHWLKVVSSDQDDSTVILVEKHSEATLLQLDGGDLAIDVSGFPEGSRSITCQPSASKDVVRPLRFVTPDTFEQQKGTGKIEFSITGSSFAFALDSGFDTWYSTFCTPDALGKDVQLFTGDSDEAMGYPVFSLQAVY